MVLWKQWNKFAPVNCISVACIIYSHIQIHIRVNLCLLNYNQWVTSYGCLYKIAHIKHEVFSYINKTWRSLWNVVCLLLPNYMC